MKGRWRIGGRPVPGALVGAAVAGAAVGSALIEGSYLDRWTFDADRAVLLSLARWRAFEGVRAAAVDLTALGSVPVLTLVVILVAGLLLVRQLWLTAAVTAVACWSGGWAVTLVKMRVHRPRPDLVPHLVEVHNLSFPSGHAAGSAIVYLTVAALATQVTREVATRRYLLAAAMLLVAAIGVSRVYLGVHWPSDVLAGWSFGALWALGWWIATASLRASIGGER